MIPPTFFPAPYTSQKNMSPPTPTAIALQPEADLDPNLC
jgi:hypothetical protein